MCSWGCLWCLAHTPAGVLWVLRARQGFFGKCLSADEIKNPKQGIFGGKKVLVADGLCCHCGFAEGPCCKPQHPRAEDGCERHVPRAGHVFCDETLENVLQKKPSV